MQPEEFRARADRHCHQVAGIFGGAFPKRAPYDGVVQHILGFESVMGAGLWPGKVQFRAVLTESDAQRDRGRRVLHLDFKGAEAAVSCAVARAATDDGAANPEREA